MLAAPAPSRATDPPVHRVEARSATLLAVALVQGDRMSIHLSRLLDNAPVRDAAVTVMLRGVLHPAVAEADGSYSLQSRELAVPGPAALEFQVVQGESRESLKGTLQIADASAAPEDKNSARQLWWWVLNFAVCTGFLILWSRRRKTAADD
jgi:hypothetical protein